MSVQFKKNVLLFCGALIVRFVLVSIEVYFNYTGIALQIVYVISVLSLFVLIWITNRPLVAELNSKVLRFLSCSAIALLLTGLYVFITAVRGIFFKLLIKGSF